MNAARAIATVAVAFACAAASGARDAALETLTGEQILARAKATFRAHVRPPFVVYTLERRDFRSGLPDLENSYTLKIWCRTSDRRALARKVWKGAPYGGMQHLVIAFDEAVDPGPPTADIFERTLYAKATPQPEPAPSSGLTVIGGVTVVREYDYRVTSRLREGELWHLRLDAMRDAYRNRIDDLWVDAATFEIRRMRVRDHLYLGMSGQSIDDEFDVRFTQRDGLPLLASIRGNTAWDEFTTEYAYKNVSFPETLPDWYFDPVSYGKHKGEAPS